MAMLIRNFLIMCRFSILIRNTSLKELINFAACCLFLMSLMAILKKYYFKNMAFLIIHVITISIFSMGIITNVNYLNDNSNFIAYYSTSILEKDVYESGKFRYI